MANPKAFYSYLENEDKLNILSDEQAGRLYKSLYAYARTGEKPDLSDDPLVAYAFADFIIDVDRDFDNYAEMCEKRAEAGRKSGESRRKKAENEQNEQTRTKGTSVHFVQTNANKNEQTRTNVNKTNETEAEAEAEYIEEKIPKKEENRPEKDFDDFAFWVISEFNRICIDLPEVSELTDKRRRLLYADGMMDKRIGDYTELFKKVHASDKLCGRSDLQWRADFDWIIKNRVKIVEGSYDNVHPPDKRGQVFSAKTANFDTSRWKAPEGCG